MILALLLLLQASAWAGDEAQECGQCHGAEAASQASTPMAQALQSVQDAKILRDHPNLSYSDGKYSYSIRREGGRSIYSVTDGNDAITAQIAWAFGFGTMGQTYVFERNGVYYEAAVSFYSGLGGLDWTPGHAGRAGGTLDEAAGRRIDPAETRRCFGCHSTGAVQGNQLRFEAMVPGVRCGPCHGDATRHVAEMRTGKAGNARMAKLSEVSTEDISTLCGKCHRTWAEIGANGPRGILNVRFQPYRLTNSKCYDTADRRIACTTCHDPHGHSVEDASFYDAKCQACHSPVTRVAATGGQSLKLCPVAKQNCITCHMPKVEIPGLHFHFTDHRIRIARTGEKYPD